MSFGRHTFGTHFFILSVTRLGTGKFNDKENKRADAGGSGGSKFRDRRRHSSPPCLYESRELLEEGDVSKTSFSRSALPTVSLCLVRP